MQPLLFSLPSELFGVRAMFPLHFFFPPRPFEVAETSTNCCKPTWTSERRQMMRTHKGYNWAVAYARQSVCRSHGLGSGGQSALVTHIMTANVLEMTYMTLGDLHPSI